MKVILKIETIRHTAGSLSSFPKNECNIGIEQEGMLLTPEQYKKVIKKLKEIEKIINLN